MGQSAFDIFREIFLPLLTLAGGWFAHLFRSRQKKESDILDNIKQILDAQRQYIAEQDKENKKTRDMNARLEKELRDANQSIRQANKCEFTNVGKGCPVIAHENEIDEKCKACSLKPAV